MGEFADYFKTWNWETGFRYSRNEGQDLSIGEASQPGLRQALLDTDPATAFNPFLGFLGHNSRAARSAVYVTLQNTGEFELPLGYATINGDLFNLPAGPVSFAIGGEYRGERMTRNRDSLNQTFQSIGSVDGQGFRATGMSGQSMRRCGFHLPAPRGISPAFTVSRLTSPSERNGTARTPLLF